MEHKIDDIKEAIVEIKLDLREHMARTRANEEIIQELRKQSDPMWKAYIGIKWSIGAIIMLAALLTSIAKIKGYL